MADALVNVTLALHETPAAVAERLLLTSEAESSSDARLRLAQEIGGLIARDAKALVRVDSVTRGAAAGVVVVDASEFVAGDKLHITLPGGRRYTFTAVDTDAEVTAAPGTGLFSIETVTETAVGDSLEAAINAYPKLRYHLSAVNAAGTVTITATELGTWAHGIKIVKEVTTAGAFTITAFAGGDDVLTQPTMAIVFGTPNITAGDTISIGRREYTWAASASADGEITLSTTEATAATNFAAAVNADAQMTGICVATRDTATVTLTFVCDPRVAQHILVTYTEANAGSVVPAGTEIITGAEAPLLGTTVTGSSTTRTITGMGAA